MSDDTREIDTQAVWAALREVAVPAVGWLLVVGGAAALAFGWFGVSGEALVARQLPYLVSGGLGGLALVVVGSLLVGGHDVRRVGARLKTMQRQLAELHAVLLVDEGLVATRVDEGLVATRVDDGLVATRVDEGLVATRVDEGLVATRVDEGLVGPRGDAEGARPSHGVVVVPGGERYHAPSCPIVAGKDHAERLSAEEAGTRGLAACKVCAPARV